MTREELLAKLRELTLLPVSCLLAIHSPALAQIPDWVIVASHREAAMGIDRASLSRSGDQATASVLMGTFKPETFNDGSTVSFYISRETFRCDARTRTEVTVTAFDPMGEVAYQAPHVEADLLVQPGSIYENVLVAACDGQTGLGGLGFAQPLEAIDAERTKRVAAGLQVVD